jgi:Fe-S cluster assembly protein SufD
VDRTIFLKNLSTVPAEWSLANDLCLVDDRPGQLFYSLSLRSPCALRLIICPGQARSIRRNVTVQLDAAAATVEIFSLLRGSDGDDARMDLSIVHRAAQTISQCTIQTIADGHCSIALQTCVSIAHPACQADLSCRSLLLTPSARVEVSPRMDIQATDARCTHGTTLGGPDPEQLFYLMSRGIDTEMAKKLIAEATAAKIFASIPKI